MKAYMAIADKTVWEIMYKGVPFLTPRRIYKDGKLLEMGGTVDECKARIRLLANKDDLQFDEYDDYQELGKEV